MNKKHVLKLFTYENGFSLIGLLDDYESLQVKYNKYSAHEFNFTVNRNIPNATLLREGIFIQVGDISDGLFLVTTCTESIDETGAGNNRYTVEGKDCRYLYKRRFIMNMNGAETWTQTGNAETVLRNLISSQTQGKRSLPITNTTPAKTVGGQLSVSEVHTNLYDVICNYCQQAGIGWKVTFDGYNMSLVFYEITNKTDLIKFDVKYESLKNGEFIDSNENYKNVVYVGGKGKGTNQAIYEAEVGDESPSGLDRVEYWDNQSSLSTEEELQKAGESKLNEFSQKTNFNGAGLEKSPYEFRSVEDNSYDIGDIVSVSFDNRIAQVEIISVTESWSYNSYKLDFEFGKPINTLSSQMNKLFNWIQRNQSTDNVTQSGVKYYTIPTDTAQPIGDVTLDIIGFTGNTGNSDKTFQLYFNSDGTGAKTYHVYFKMLEGTGKLILTTGVQGKNNLEFTAGTYVSIIYVDTEGNVNLTIGLNDSTVSGSTSWSSEKTQTELDGKLSISSLTPTRVYPLYVDGNCASSGLNYFATKNKDGWINITITLINFNSPVNLTNGSLVFKHKLGDYISGMFDNNNPYRAPGVLGTTNARYNVTFDFLTDGRVLCYFLDGTAVSPDAGLNNIGGMYGVNLFIYAPDYND